MDLVAEAKIRKATKMTRAMTKLGNKDMTLLMIRAPLFQAPDKSMGTGSLIVLTSLGGGGRERYTGNDLGLGVG